MTLLIILFKLFKIIYSQNFQLCISLILNALSLVKLTMLIKILTYFKYFMRIISIMPLSFILFCHILLSELLHIIVLYRVFRDLFLFTLIYLWFLYFHPWSTQLWLGPLSEIHITLRRLARVLTRCNNIKEHWGLILVQIYFIGQFALTDSCNEVPRRLFMTLVYLIIWLILWWAPEVVIIYDFLDFQALVQGFN